jgi:REP element-mobilizing transposase RayT
MRGYDYSSAAYYFVTLVTLGRALLFEDARHRTIADDTWRWMTDHHSYVGLDKYVIMPNHVHGIVVIKRRAPKSLSRLIGAFKTVSTRRINELHGTSGRTVWQRGFYERIVRNERELNAIRQYVIDNPVRWAEDKHNPDACASAER